jgi:hypothetical protein
MIASRMNENQEFVEAKSLPRWLTTKLSRFFARSMPSGSEPANLTALLTGGPLNDYSRRLGLRAKRSNQMPRGIEGLCSSVTHI